MEKMILPLGNGIGVYEKGRLCVSMIDSSGSKKVGGRFVKTVNKFFSLPIVRGFTFLFYGIWLYIASFKLLGELEDRPENEKNKSFKIAKNVTIASTYIVLIAMLLAAFLFGFLFLGLFPAFLFHKAFPDGSSYYLRSSMIALLRFALLYLIFVGLRFVPFMSGLYSFNGAGNVQMSGKEETIRPRTYPLNFLNFLLNIFLFSTFVISLLSVNIFWPVNFLLNLLLFLTVVPIVYEILRFASVTKAVWVKDVAIVTNWLVSIRPTTTQSEVLAVARKELDFYSDFEKTENGRVAMSSLYAEMETKLKASDKFEPSDCDWIISTVLNKNRAEAKLERSVSLKEYREIVRACDRRAKGEPLSNIFGFVEFYGLRFDVNKKVLSPRMETEILVEEALKKINETDAENVLDLCTGSGAIAISIAKFSSCKVSASDISKQALAVAEANAKKNEVKVEFCQSDLMKSLKKGRKYDIIVSNPPYIKSGDIEKLDIEVKKYDPKLALDGGEDGLDFYRKIIDEAKSKLTKKGWLMFEVGQGQSDGVCELMQKAGYDNVQAVKDYSKIERVIYGRLSK
ncbi:MAG: peptide chain release factor N(5)-glutamine methyltransferase [Clostridia bacterium]|jgi:release factor glutamine methyltransferase|nr:peptide chain release factor N(5)-glutamine methyltransferase [Clostridia bacterium]